MAKFLMELFEFKATKNDPVDTKYYRLGCDCGSSDCDLAVEVSIHERLDPTLTFTVEVSTRSYSQPTPWYWLNGIINRVTVAAKVLIFGEVKQHKEFCLGRNNVDAFEHLIKYVKSHAEPDVSSG